jgi:hypothetical protein
MVQVAYARNISRGGQPSEGVTVPGAHVAAPLGLSGSVITRYVGAVVQNRTQRAAFPKDHV